MCFITIAASDKTPFAFFPVCRHNTCVSHASLNRLRCLSRFPWYCVTMHVFHMRIDHCLSLLSSQWMRVHVFWNCPSLSIATYGLQRTVANCWRGRQGFHFGNFYVDDVLMSLPTSSEAVDFMLRTKASLKAEGRIRLHKIASKSADVMSTFPVEDLEKNLKCLTLGEGHVTSSAQSWYVMGS